MSVVIVSLHLRSLLRGCEQNHTGEWPLFSKHFEIPNDRNGHDGDVVRELYGVMAAKGAAGGFIVTSGSFTQEAQEFAQGRNVKLLNGPQLHALLKRASKDEKGRNPKRSLLAPLLVDWALPALRDCVRRPLRSIARRR